MALQDAVDMVINALKSPKNASRVPSVLCLKYSQLKRVLDCSLAGQICPAINGDRHQLCGVRFPGRRSPA